MAENSLNKSNTGIDKKAIVNIWNKYNTYFVFIFIFIIFSAFVPNFFSITNGKVLLLDVSMIGMLSCTMAFCIASGNYDLSIESVVAFSGVLTAFIINFTGSVFLGIMLGILTGGIIGLMNGLLVVKLNINSLIITLATMQLIRGLAYLITTGKTIIIKKESFFILGNFRPLTVPIPIWITILCFIIFSFLIRNTIFGKNVLAIGSNTKKSRLSGVSIDKNKIAIYIIQGIMASFAGIIFASRMTSGNPMVSQGLSIEVITACILGGVALSGGIASVPKLVIGVLIMGMIKSSLNLLDIQYYIQDYIFPGLILGVALLIDRLQHRES